MKNKYYPALGFGPMGGGAPWALSDGFLCVCISAVTFFKPWKNIIFIKIVKTICWWIRNSLKHFLKLNFFLPFVTSSPLLMSAKSAFAPAFCGIVSKPISSNSPGGGGGGGGGGPPAPFDFVTSFKKQNHLIARLENLNSNFYTNWCNFGDIYPLQVPNQACCVVFFYKGLQLCESRQPSFSPFHVSLTFVLPIFQHPISVKLTSFTHVLDKWWWGRTLKTDQTNFDCCLD